MSISPSTYPKKSVPVPESVTCVYKDCYLPTISSEDLMENPQSESVEKAAADKFKNDANNNPPDASHKEVEDFSLAGLTNEQATDKSPVMETVRGNENKVAPTFLAEDKLDAETLEKDIQLEICDEDFSGISDINIKSLHSEASQNESPTKVLGSSTKIGDSTILSNDEEKKALWTSAAPVDLKKSPTKATGSSTIASSSADLKDDSEKKVIWTSPDKLDDLKKVPIKTKEVTDTCKKRLLVLTMEEQEDIDNPLWEKDLVMKLDERGNKHAYVKKAWKNPIPTTINRNVTFFRASAREGMCGSRLPKRKRMSDSSAPPGKRFKTVSQFYQELVVERRQEKHRVERLLYADFMDVVACIMGPQNPHIYPCLQYLGVLPQPESHGITVIPYMGLPPFEVPHVIFTMYPNLPLAAANMQNQLIDVASKEEMQVDKLENAQAESVKVEEYHIKTNEANRIAFFNKEQELESQAVVATVDEMEYFYST